jgi:hypothetical protein
MEFIQDSLKDERINSPITKVDPKQAPIFSSKDYSQQDKRAIYRYLYAHQPKKFPPSLKNMLINLYDPITDRVGRFPDGLRWCLNVNVGCENNCGHCYVNVWNTETVGINPHQKADFEKDLVRDIEGLISLDVPPAPMYLSNSTDPLQTTLENRYRHTLFALKLLARHRSRFTSLVLLTKNAAMLCQRELHDHDELVHYGIPETQIQHDVEQLVRFAQETGAKAGIAKPLKVPISRKAQRCKDWFGEL